MQHPQHQEQDQLDCLTLQLVFSLVAAAMRQLETIPEGQAQEEEMSVVQFRSLVR